MRSCFLILFLTLCLQTSQAQEQVAKDTTKITPKWKHGLVGNLTTSQVAYTDWAQGGENALSWMALIDGISALDTNKYDWRNTYKFSLGKTRLGDQGTRKTDDRIELESVLKYRAGLFVDPYIAASLKTQFVKGYLYKAGEPDTPVSDFFDPAYLTQSLGLGYQPMPEIRVRLGIGLREVITSTFNKYADDPATPDVEKTLVDGGIESVINADWKIAPNILFSSALEFFDPLKRMNEPAIRSNSTLTAKVSKYIAVILNLQTISEKRITPKTQIKQSLSFGLTYTFI